MRGSLDSERARTCTGGRAIGGRCACGRTLLAPLSCPRRAARPCASLRASGVALNLTVASHIYLMDPWWNPAAEYQAIDRAHRLGQHKPIRAVRVVAR